MHRLHVFIPTFIISVKHQNTLNTLCVLKMTHLVRKERESWIRTTWSKARRIHRHLNKLYFNGENLPLCALTT